MRCRRTRRREEFTRRTLKHLILISLIKGEKERRKKKKKKEGERKKKGTNKRAVTMLMVKIDARTVKREREREPNHAGNLVVSLWWALLSSFFIFLVLSLTLSAQVINECCH